MPLPIFLKKSGEAHEIQILGYSVLVRLAKGVAIELEGVIRNQWSSWRLVS